MFQYFSYKERFSAAQWWTLKLKQFERAGDLNGAKFAHFMVGLHSCVASSAGIERWFSTIGFVWSKVRNRLGFKKAEKLATVYRGLRATSSKNKTPIQIVPTAAPAAAVDGDDVDDIELQPEEAEEIFGDDDSDFEDGSLPSIDLHDNEDEDVDLI